VGYTQTDKFKLGDYVMITGTKIEGPITHITHNDDFTRYKVDGKYYNEASLKNARAENARRTRLHRALDAVYTTQDERAWNSASPTTRYHWLMDDFDEDDARQLIHKRWGALPPDHQDRISGVCIPNSARK
jgi:hypothetical protein